MLIKVARPHEVFNIGLMSVRFLRRPLRKKW